MCKGSQWRGRRREMDRLVGIEIGTSSYLSGSGDKFNWNVPSPITATVTGRRSILKETLRLILVDAKGGKRQLLTLRGSKRLSGLRGEAKNAEKHPSSSRCRLNPFLGQGPHWKGTPGWNIVLEAWGTLSNFLAMRPREVLRIPKDAVVGGEWVVGGGIMGTPRPERQVLSGFRGPQNA